jgi:hypothetical protein
LELWRCDDDEGGVDVRADVDDDDDEDNMSWAGNRVAGCWVCCCWRCGCCCRGLAIVEACRRSEPPLLGDRMGSGLLPTL